MITLSSFFKGNNRTIKARKNIALSIFIKGFDSAIYLLLVPITLGYLNQYEYGIWLTLNSILTWINSFDIGLGNGLRNKLAEAIALNNKPLARIYVSTTFSMLLLLIGLLILLGSIFYPFIDWYNILSTNSNNVPNLDKIVYLSFIIFCFNLVFKLIGNIYLALQLPAINNLMVTLGHFLSLVIIYILTISTTGNLLFVALAYSASPLIIYLIAYPITFIKIYPYLLPSFKLFKKQHLKDLFNIGVQFFFLQLSGLVLFAFSNILISHQFGPQQVTPFNISYRYFSICLMIVGIILSPYWSATTEAYVNNDFNWIKRTMSNIHKILIVITLILLLMFFISNFIYRIWVGNSVDIPYNISIFMALYICILIWSLSYSNFLNGLGKLKIQTINTICVAILYYPICSFLGSIYGICGILIGMCLLNTSSLILNCIQFNKIISHKANGIWNK